MFAIGAQLYSWMARKKLVGIKKYLELNKKTKKQKNFSSIFAIYEAAMDGGSGS